MSHAERTGTRSLVYSGWHRPASISRYVGRVAAAKLSMIDVDACEYCCYCGEPVALIETQESTAPPKSARVLTTLARMAGIPAYSVSVAVVDGEIDGFQVQELTPSRGVVLAMTPQVYAYWLLALRDHHACSQAVSA